MNISVGKKLAHKPSRLWSERWLQYRRSPVIGRSFRRQRKKLGLSAVNGTRNKENAIVRRKVLRLLEPISAPHVGENRNTMIGRAPKSRARFCHKLDE